jgi:hypothetical protein
VVFVNTFISVTNHLRSAIFPLGKMGGSLPEISLMRAILSIALVSVTASFLAGCSGPQTTSSAQPQPATQTAQACSPGEMVYMAGSRLKQPCGSMAVQTGKSF